MGCMVATFFCVNVWFMINFLTIAASMEDVSTNMADGFTVELLIVVDYSAYLEWYHKMSGPLRSGRKQSPLSSIWRHFTSVIHGADSIYKGAEKRGLKISVELVDIKIIKTDGIVKSEDNVITSDRALETFYNWTQSVSDLPEFDHAMLVTGLNLVKRGNTSETGRAYFGTMCSAKSLSVVENEYSYEIVQITAHELGHSLGAMHDGEENNCSPERGYLMAAMIAINSKNRWYLSSCSIDNIRTQIQQLKRDRKLCLLTKHDSNNGSTGIPMGGVYTPDDQCELIEGSGSYMCRDFYLNPGDYHDICSNIWCHVTRPGENRCNNYEGSDGYVCGNRKVCVKGKCVFKETSQKSVDHCPQGDQPGIVWKNYTCLRLVQFEPEMCYDNNTRSRCCLSCTKINTGVQECEFGDKSSWCRTDLKVPMGCYSNENLCCGTCKKHRDQTRPKCPYGDKSLWCRKTLKPASECHLNQDLCCGTCASYHNGTQTDPKCKDKHKSCAEIAQKGYCLKKQAKTKKVCPKSCNMCEHNSNPLPQKKKSSPEKDNNSKQRLSNTGSDCKDRKKRCPSFAKKGYCTKGKKMKIYCPRSCSICGESKISETSNAVTQDTRMATKDSECEDKHLKCTRLAKKGHCSGRRGTKCAEFAQRHVMCKGAAKLRRREHNKTSDTTNTDRISPKGLECEDKYKKCAKFAERGYCNGPTEVKMRKRCPKSCNMCSECKDKYKKCTKLAEKGYCGGPKKTKMRKFCPKSCKVCQDKQEKP